MCTEHDKSKEVASHPLFGREVRPICNWHEWLKRWKEAKDFQEFDGLIHCGFCVPIEKSRFREEEYTENDRIEFYFWVAYGWTDHTGHLLKFPGDTNERFFVDRDSINKNSGKTLSELRQMLAGKAFDQLCLNFFKTEMEGEGGPSVWGWERRAASEQLLPVIKNFFRPEKAQFGDIRILNISHRSERSHNEKKAVDFLLKLTVFIFGWREQEIWSGLERELREEMGAENVAVRSRLDSAKPWMIEVLSYLNRLDLLREWIFELNEHCLAKIEEIALRSELSHRWHPGKENRLVASIEEACLVGSPAALLLNEHKVRMKECKRLTTILEEKRQKESALREAEEKSRS